jgi:hypothetical protein
MHNLSTLLTHLNTTLTLSKPFKIDFAKDKDVVTSTPGSIIKIYLGYSTVEESEDIPYLDSPADGSEFLSTSTQFTIIQFECDTDDVPDVVCCLRSAMYLYNPIDEIEANYSGYTRHGGGAKGLVNGRYSWQEVYKIQFSFQA